MYQISVLIFNTLILIQMSKSIPQSTIFSCCDWQSSFLNNTCSNKQLHKMQRFPEKLLMIGERNLPSQPEAYFHLSVKSGDSHFQCNNLENLVKFTLHSTFASSSTQSSQNNAVDTTFLFNDGYMQFHKHLFSPKSYCIDRLSDDHTEIDVFICNSTITHFPKCCPWGQFSRWLHPELCQKPLNENLTSTLSKSGHNFYYHPINCIVQHKMVETIRANVFNQTQLDSLLTNQFTHPGSFCVEDVLTSHDSEFDWEYNVGLFYCGQDWPYHEFGVTDVETVMYGGCLALSSIFLLVAIFVYCIRLQKTHCHVHTWIELFYMISLLSLAIFCILHINFPEDHLAFCSIYHLFSAFGYFVSAIGVFTWATLLSVELYLAFKDLRPVVGFGFKQGVGRLVFYSCFGHLFPIFISASTFGYSYYWKNTGYCINTDYPVIRIIFAALLIANFICGICTLQLILRHRKCAMLATGNRATKSNQRLNQLISCAIKLYLICGITFAGIVIGDFTGTVRSSAWYYMLYRAFLSLRGVTVFCIFICNKKTKKLLYLYFRKERLLCSCGTCNNNESTRVRKRRLHSTLRGTDTISS